MDSITVLSVTASPTDTYTYTWSPATFLTASNVYNPQMSSNVVGNYTYSVTVTNSNGCSKKGSIYIEVMDCFRATTGNGEIKIYSGVSPNGDNHNDTWIIDGIESEPNNTVIILNKWGQEVWKIEEYNNLDKVWKGTNKNGEALTDGTYYYIVTTSTNTYKGRVEVIR